MSDQPAASVTPLRRVRMESPDALFAPDAYIQAPVPGPLLLFRCVRPLLAQAYPTRLVDGQKLITDPRYTFQRNQVSFADGSVFVAEASGSAAYGLPSVNDTDYFLGMLLLSEERGDAKSGAIRDFSHADAVRSARQTTKVAREQREAAKRACRRWANTSVLTRMNLVQVPPAVTPGRRKQVGSGRVPTSLEKERVYNILTYELETETYSDGESADRVRLLAINPVWMRHADQAGVMAWIDIHAHNVLSSSIAKAMYLELAMMAAEGHLPPHHLAPLTWWRERIGVYSTDKPGKVADAFRSAIEQLKEQRIVEDGAVEGRHGRYDVRLDLGPAVLSLAIASGIQRLEPVETRTLLWHLAQINITPGEGRALLVRHGARVREMLQYIHYLRTVKQGLDKDGNPIQAWSSYLVRGLEGGWKLSPDFLAWRDYKLRALIRLASQESETRVAAQRPGSAEHAAADARPEHASEPTLEPEIEPSDVWRAAILQLRDPMGEASFRTWLAPTWLVAVEQERVVVGTPNTFAAEWISAKHGLDLEEILSRSLGRPVKLTIVHSAADS